MSNVTGYVQEISTKNGVGKRGAWTLYGVKVNDAWYSGGFDAPAFKQGDYVAFSVIERIDKKGNKQLDIDKTTVKQETPPKAATPGQASAQGEPGARQDVISYQAARNAAVAAVDVLLKNALLPLPAATKKNEAERYQIVLDALNKLTVQFFYDTSTLRLLETVEDAGEEEDEPSLDSAGEEEP